MSRHATPSYNLAVVHPHLAAQWSVANPLPASAFTPGSKAYALWTCKLGHTWRARILSRRHSTNCPTCSGRFATPERNLAALHPELVRQWSPRNPKPPQAFTPGSVVRAWWHCPRGHEWQASIQTRTRGHGCPVCSGRQTTPEGSLAALQPQLTAQWSPRNPRPPSEFSPMSHAKVWWRCANGHEWQAIISARTSGAGCRYCSGYHPTPVRNLAILYPHLAQEWSPLNCKPPTAYPPYTPAKVWWRCAQGHTWQASILNRARNGVGCAFCAGRRPTPERNLAILYPHLAQEWSPFNLKTPNQYTPGSHAKVLWDCPQGHAYSAPIKARVAGNLCTVCWSLNFRSAPEIALADALAAWLGQTSPPSSYAITGLHWPSGHLITPDFALDDAPIKFAVEYDGRFFHRPTVRVHHDQLKNQLLRQAGFLPIRLREAPLPVLDPRLDLILDPALVYSDRALGFPGLVALAQRHVAAVCQQEYGADAWCDFLSRRSLA